MSAPVELRSWFLFLRFAAPALCKQHIHDMYVPTVVVLKLAHRCVWSPWSQFRSDWMFRCDSRFPRCVEPAIMGSFGLVGGYSDGGYTFFLLAFQEFFFVSSKCSSFLPGGCVRVVAGTRKKRLPPFQLATPSRDIESISNPKGEPCQQHVHMCVLQFLLPRQLIAVLQSVGTGQAPAVPQ